MKKLTGEQVISTYLNYMPKGYAHFYPYPAGNIRDVNHTWWKQVSNAIGTSVFVDNAWGGTTVVGGDSATESLVRLNTLLLQGNAPDIVLIFMGTNDARAKYTNATFEASYRKMISNIQKIAPDTEIIVCTLMDFSVTNFYDAKTKDDYNEVIKKVAADNNISVIDLKDVEFAKSDLIDSVHPNYSGHKKMAEVIIKQLKELK
jgi:lysophospholipase L1-like esterase